jgi:heptosyltransferase-3
MRLNQTYQKILVSSGSGIGDIILATPMIRSLRLAYPNAVIDVLVTEGRAQILNGNPDISEVIESVRGRGILGQIKFIRKIWRKYDLAISAQAGDRYMFNTWIASRNRISWVSVDTGLQRFKKQMLGAWVDIRVETHTVIKALRLLDSLAIPKSWQLVPPICSEPERMALESMLPFSRDTRDYVVIHVFPRNLYKCWTTDGWETVIRHLISKGIAVVLTGASGETENTHINNIIERGFDSNLVNLAGIINLPQASDLLSGALLYLGTDTGMTHLAAAQAIPTIAIFGPSIPAQWGPWPSGYCKDETPYEGRVSQRVGNVFIVRSDIQCEGSGNEGCFKDLTRPRLCLQSLTAETVLATVEQVLSENI